MIKFLTSFFLSLAVNSEPFSAELFALYQPELMDAINRGPVLVHCASSKRAGRVEFKSFELKRSNRLKDRCILHVL